MFRPSFVTLTAVAILVAAAFGASRLLASPTASSSLPSASPAGQVTLYGHVKSLTRKGGRFQMRFDPAIWLTGYAAQRAALQDTGSTDVPNDYYIVDESHRVLTFLVSPTASVTVLTEGINRKSVTVTKLAQIVAAKKSGFGFWVRIGNKYPNPVVALDQQYQP